MSQGNAKRLREEATKTVLETALHSVTGLGKRADRKLKQTQVQAIYYLAVLGTFCNLDEEATADVYHLDVEEVPVL